VKLMKRVVLGIILLFVMAGLVIAGVTVYADTRSPLSIAAFKIGYSITPFTTSYLSFYSPLRRDVSGGYIPPEVDEFLCSTAETTEDLNEFNAIVHFYSLQAGSREGNCIFSTTDGTREKIAARIVETLNEAEYSQQIILLEQVRLGKSLGKGFIGHGPGERRFPTTQEQEKAWYYEKALPFARLKYIEWWNSGKTWAEKKQTDPLAGEFVHVNACCG
jgi:hypothetical protein